LPDTGRIGAAVFGREFAVKRLFGIGRSRAGRVGLVAGVVVAALGGLALPAYAHHAIVSGSTVCANNDHVITWSIGNNRDDELMTIESATATINGQSYAVTGYTSPVGFSGTTTATTVVPGPVTGTITLSVHVTWPTYDNTNTADVPLEGTCGCGCTSTTTSPTTAPTTTTTTDNRCDAVNGNNGGDDPQGHNNPDCDTTTTLPVTTTTQHHCGCSTTTTTVPETTTTVPETTTTVAETTTTEHHCECSTTTTEATTTTVPETTTTVPETTTSEATTTTSEPTTTSTQALGTTTIVTTTTLGHQGSTVPTTQPPTTQPPTSTTQSAPPAGELPFTGSGMTFPLIFGLGSLILGAVFAFRKRDAWTR
jgi:LPXTG-motif cell wall-anchored protein